MEFKVPLAILLTLVGCHVNIVSLECVIHHDNGKRVGSLITFLQFLLLSGAGFLFLNKTVARGYFTLRERPPRSLMLTIGFFFLTNLLNNNVYQYNLSVPVVTVIRVSSLIATLVLGMGYMKKKYTKRQIVAVFLVFLGVSLVSVNVVPSSSSDLISHKTQNPQEDSRKLGSEPERQAGGKTDVPVNPSKNVLPVEEWAWTTIPPEVLGLSILFFSTMGSSVLSLAQESVYKTDPRLGPMDLLFFSHFCSLPLFLSHGSDITSSLLLVRNQQELWNPILANLISQCVCIFSVFYLTKSTNALTTNVIITGRKFFSLLFSVWYFQNPFSLQQWLGSVLAFWGVLFYSLPKPPEQSKQGTV